MESFNGFLIYAGVQGEEDAKKKAKKPMDQNYFHGTHKYTNGSHGYLSVFLVFVLFPSNVFLMFYSSSFTSYT